MAEPPLIDIRRYHWEIVQDILRKHVPDRGVWAFGSRARWTAKQYSDLDLAVLGNEALDLETLAGLEEDFSESDLPFKVDVVDWATTAETFRGIIEKGRVVVQREDVAGGWSKMTLREANVTLIDCDHRTPPSADTGYPYVAIPQLRCGRVDLSNVRRITREHFLEWTRKAKPSANDVILSRRCNPGETAIVPPDLEFALGQNLVILRADGTKVYPPLLRWLVRGPEWWEQIIELNRRMNADLEAMARALFKDWFVDFGPVRAKVEGRPAYLAPGIWDLFPDSLDDEDKPVGWRWGTLGDVAALNPETWGSQNAPNYVSYVDLSNTKWGYIDKIETYEWASAPSRARRILRAGDTIVGTVRPGNGSFTFIAEDGLTGSTGFAVLRPNTMQERELVWCAATSTDNIERLSHLADGGAYPAVRPEIVAATEIVIGDDSTRHVFSRTSAPFLDRIESNKQESRSLSQLRDLLLPKLISGEIRVRDAEKAVEAIL